MEYLGTVVLVIFLCVVVMIMFVIVDPLMAYHHVLPADDMDNLAGITDIRWDERVKQYWSHMFLDMSKPVLELGCGNTAVSLHTSRVIFNKDKHYIIVPTGNPRLEVLGHNMALLQTTPQLNPTYPEPPGTLIVHYDGQDMLPSYLSFLTDNDSPTHILMLECNKDMHAACTPILQSHGWERIKKYIHLAVWCRKKK